jgi:hypothetical protein
MKSKYGMIRIIELVNDAILNKQLGPIFAERCTSCREFNLLLNQWVIIKKYLTVMQNIMNKWDGVLC